MLEVSSVLVCGECDSLVYDGVTQTFSSGGLGSSIRLVCQASELLSSHIALVFESGKVTTGKNTAGLIQTV